MGLCPQTRNEVHTSPSMMSNNLVMSVIALSLFMDNRSARNLPHKATVRGSSVRDNGRGMVAFNNGLDNNQSPPSSHTCNHPTDAQRRYRGHSPFGTWRSGELHG